jgi:hypothetical protein
MTYRNKRLTESARNESCVSCGSDDGTIVWAHSNELEHGKGISIKAHDLFGAYLCWKCHSDFDQCTDREYRKKVFRIWWEASMVRACEKGYL